MTKTHSLHKFSAFTALAAFVAVILSGCSGDYEGISTNQPREFSLDLSGPNVVQVKIGGMDLCGKNSYMNEPCTSVTLCEPDQPSNCQTISDVLVDTGSTGLRVFQSLVTLSLPAVTDSSSNPLAECAQFGTGSDWGPIVRAQVKLASETGVDIPIQLINKTYFSPPSQCSDADATPSEAGFNGILGVGLFKEDCGSFCASYQNNQNYYSCSGSGCSSAAASLSQQLQNPVAHFTVNNNGVVLEFPLISAEGATTVTGAMVFGIGTQTNNTPSDVTLYAANSQGNFVTSFGGITYSSSFIDSGSNGLFFDSAIQLCGSSSTGFYCPTSAVSLSGVIKGTSGSPQIQIPFQIDSASKLFGTGYTAFNNLGGKVSLVGFDWGLPFFFGRRVFVGIENRSSSLGTGPYWAF